MAVLPADACASGHPVQAMCNDDYILDFMVPSTHNWCARWRSTTPRTPTCACLPAEACVSGDPTQAMCNDYYILDFMDPSIDTRPIAPALAAFFDNVLTQVRMRQACACMFQSAQPPPPSCSVSWLLQSSSVIAPCLLQNCCCQCA